jgi:hypothetical protein
MVDIDTNAENRSKKMNQRTQKFIRIIIACSIILLTQTIFISAFAETNSPTAIAASEIDISPTEFSLNVQQGRSTSSNLTIDNLGDATLNWSIDVSTGGTTATGLWTLHYDWDCDGTIGSTDLTLNSDNSFTTGEGHSGTWTQTDNLIVFTFTGGTGTVYTGYIAGPVMAGTSDTNIGLTGCWEALHPPLSTASIADNGYSSAAEFSPGPNAAPVDEFGERDSQQAAATWLSAIPDSGATPGSNSTGVSIDVNATGLGLGNHYGLLRVRSDDPDEALIAVPVVIDVLAPDIAVSSAGYSIQLPEGGSSRRSLTIDNLTDTELSWTVEVSTGSTNLLGEWILNFDWGCTGSPGVTTITFNSDNTFTTGDDGSGTWSQINNEIEFTFTTTTQYRGYIAGLHMAGTSDAGGGLTGCWETMRPPAQLVGLQSRDRTAGGEISKNPNATTYLRLDADVALDVVSAWLSVLPDSGSVNGINSETVSVDIDALGLAPDTYYGLLRLKSNDPDEALIALPVVLEIISAPDIKIHPASFDLTAPLGGDDTQNLKIDNLGSLPLDWTVDLSTGGLISQGVWNLIFDWGCTGSPGNTLLTLNSDFTFTTDDGGSGTWSQTENMVGWTYTNGTHYTGYIAGTVMAGTMQLTDGFPGCWEAIRPPQQTITLKSGEYTSGGDPSVDRGTFTKQLPIQVDAQQLASTWLSLTPDMGTIPGSNSQNAAVSADATGLTLGMYYGLMRIRSNDPDEALIAVPVKLTVGQSKTYLPLLLNKP